MWLLSNAEYCRMSETYLMPTYRPLPVAFVRGEGPHLWDADGRKYLDFVAGIAVCSTGHCHPKVVAAVQQQAATLMHTSNLYCIPPQAKLARRLCEISFADRCFFANSGAEANEAAIKLARKWAGVHKPTTCRTIVTAQRSFHGRTLAAITATGQDKYKKPFAPLPPGFRHVPYDDVDALRGAIDDDVCGVMLEPVQGEAGVIVPSDDYLAAVRGICDEHHILLILDEVQTGMGRTGRWFAYQHSGIQPDIMTLAKALGSGLPIGACLATEDVAAAFAPGDHASTFGGNYVACAAALATVEVIEQEGLVDRAERMGQLLQAQLSDLARTHRVVSTVRGKGLLVAFELSCPVARQLQTACLERGLIVNAQSDTIIRLAPPLVITESHVEEAIGIIAGALAAIVE